MASELDALAARVRRLEDIEAIRTTWRDYCIRLDSFDLARLGDVFTEDAVLEVDGLDTLGGRSDGAYKGRAAIIGDFYGKVADMPALAVRGAHSTGHIATNMQVELAGDEATTLGYFFEIVANDIVLIGTYQHRVRRESDRWRFSFKRIAVRYKAKLMASEVAGQSLPAVLGKPGP
jgi:hypothetical protein